MARDQGVCGSPRTWRELAMDNVNDRFAAISVSRSAMAADSRWPDPSAWDSQWLGLPEQITDVVLVHL